MRCSESTLGEGAFQQEAKGALKAVIEEFSKDIICRGVGKAKQGWQMLPGTNTGKCWKGQGKGAVTRTVQEGG